jgi:peptidoglycan/xylan/chitin deacetylase (PgdA/CDA1 family)
MKILLKHGLKRSMGGLAALSQRWVPPPPIPQVSVLMYHRVADTACFDWALDDWNVTPRRFEQQIAWLAENAECIPAGEVMSRSTRAAGAKPVVAVTFDDGFGNFATQALPVLERYRVPATVFLVTRYVGTHAPYPFDQWAHRNLARTTQESWRPITWKEVDRCVAGGLITFGSHSDTHPQPSDLTEAQLSQEATQSRVVLRSRLGDAHAMAYGFPMDPRV